MQWYLSRDPKRKSRAEKRGATRRKRETHYGPSSSIAPEWKRDGYRIEDYRSDEHPGATGEAALETRRRASTYVSPREWKEQRLHYLTRYTCTALLCYDARQRRDTNAKPRNALPPCRLRDACRQRAASSYPIFEHAFYALVSRHHAISIYSARRDGVPIRR